MMVFYGVRVRVRAYADISEETEAVIGDPEMVIDPAALAG